MLQRAILSFSIQPFRAEVLSVTPVVDGVPLTKLVSRFEHERHFEPADGYGGLIPEWFNYGPSLGHYFLGRFDEDSYFKRLGGIYLLGCQCGEVGCWPLIARVASEGQSVIWDSFQQEHRPERDYSDLGPFAFDVNQYRQAAAGLDQELAARRELI